jgi:hypothetical protein
MASRLDLHNELLKFSPTVYFQPPANIQMKYPCIVYHKTNINRAFADNAIYRSLQGYLITVIDVDPDTPIPEELQKHFLHCVITQTFHLDSMNNTNLTLYY